MELRVDFDGATSLRGKLRALDHLLKYWVEMGLECPLVTVRSKKEL